VSAGEEGDEEEEGLGSHTSGGTHSGLVLSHGGVPFLKQEDQQHTSAGHGPGAAGCAGSGGSRGAAATAGVSYSKGGSRGVAGAMIGEDDDEKTRVRREKNR
jgi:hypothetical protein